MFQDQRILPVLLMGINDLEYLLDLEYGNKGHSFSEILIRKATHPSGKLTTWAKFFEVENYTFKRDSDVLGTIDVCKNRALAYLKLKGARDQDVVNN